MTPLLSPGMALLLLVLFAAGMLVATVFFGRKIGSQSIEGFLVADRNVGYILGGTSIAASWTWAVALMVSVQMAYQYGLAGAFWFTVPNVLAVLLFVWLGPRIRDKIPEGYSLPEWIHLDLKSRPVTVVYLLVYFYYQVMAVTVQVYAGASLLGAATGISPLALMPAVLIITLSYALISGIQASVVTDLIQLILMLVPGWIIIFFALSAGKMHLTLSGTGSGSINPFTPSIALTLGVITSISLFTNAIGDQQFWQRCLTIGKGSLRKSFVLGAILFATIPLGFSLLGFLAASPELGVSVPKGVDPALIGFATVERLLPAGLASLYVVILLAGLCSTLDSGLSAASSLYALVHRGLGRDPHDTQLQLRHGRIAMLVVGAIGLALGYAVALVPGFGLKYLFWALGTMGACVVIPTVLSLYWNRLTARGVLVGFAVGLLVGLPLVVYGSITGKDALLAATYSGILLQSAASCLFFADWSRGAQRRVPHAT